MIKDGEGQLVGMYRGAYPVMVDFDRDKWRLTKCSQHGTQLVVEAQTLQAVAPLVMMDDKQTIFATTKPTQRMERIYSKAVTEFLRLGVSK